MKKSGLLKLFALVAAMMCALGMQAAEAYACYTPSNTTLSFYYDDLRSSHSGTTYDLNINDDNPAWREDGTNASVTQVVFDSSFANARPTSTYCWFRDMENLQSITGLARLNTSEVTNMCWMFSNCKLLTSLDVSHFNTAKVTLMYRMFDSCSKITTLDLSNFNTSNVTNMSFMFSYCWALLSVDLSSFNTVNVTDMESMFRSCENLTSLDVSHFFTSNVTDMSFMFAGCEKLTSLDVSHFNTDKVTDMNNMFTYCRLLTSFDLSDFNTANVTDMHQMFFSCYFLEVIYVGDEWSTEAVIDSHNMFTNCLSLVGGKGTTFDKNHVDASYAHIDGGPDDPGYMTDIKEAYACYTPSNTTLTFYYDDLRSSRPGTTYDLNINDDNPAWKEDGTNASVTQVVFDSSFANARPKTTKHWFYGMRYIQSITGIENLNTSNVVNMDNMFYYCTALNRLDLSGFNTVNVTQMKSMFSHCYSLTNLDLSSFNTANVTDMMWMFYDCPYLETIVVGDKWSTSAVTISAGMFYECPNLVGGQGTAYDEDHTDATYAHIDGGISNPGYLTAAKGYDFYVDGIYYKYDGGRFVKVVNDGNISYGCYSGTLVIPETVEYEGWTYTVTTIGEQAFFRCPSLRKVTIPFTVDRIESEAFVDAFYEFPSQSSIVCLAMTPPSVSSTAFDDVYSADMTLYVPYGCKSAYQAANYWNWFGTIEELNYSFVENSIYYKITGDGTVSVTYKDSNYDTYSGRKVIPETVTKGDVTYTVTAIDNLAFFNCADLLSVKIPETVTLIGNRAFKGCTSLTRITVPNSVVTIGMNAFDGCTLLEHVTLGSGVRMIAGSAFYACSALESGDVICLATTPPSLTPSAFYNNQYARTIVYVPKGCLSAYQNHDVWGNFYNLRELISLDEALNVAGGTFSFTTWEDYPWTTVEEGGRVYAKSGNAGVPNSISRLIATVTVPEGGATLSFDFQAFGDGWGSGAVDKCTFTIDGVEEFTEGEIPYWETYEVELTAGDHTMTWTYTKNASIDPQGDYFAIDNVCLKSNQTEMIGDVNGDGYVDVGDVTALISAVLGNATIDMSLADVNNDNEVDVGDVTALIALVLGN